ncbi:Undecaprenyl phosphate-alpha-4-amino-4-deoxy-L-arabinose arabinosyl transferase [Candidatus Hartigia pinicola]|nr:Undecaprenyl phosphate-alpha-4-amino-4-deoxy-L-arabinose arabinosyl transferase [Candidatus Hartigia pinicola]
MINNKITYLKWCLLLIFVLITYFIPLNGRLLWQPDELRYAEISRELILSCNFNVPTLLNVRYFEKPIFGYWVNAFFQILFGENNISVRLGVVFSTLTSALFIYLSAKMAWEKTIIAFNAAFIYLSMLIVLTVGTYNILDPIVTSFITMTMFFLQWGMKTKKFFKKLIAFTLLGISCGLGLMTKGFLVLVLFMLLVFFNSIYYKQFKKIFPFFLISLCVMCIICLPWAIIIAKCEPDYWHYFFWIEHIQRFMSNNAQNKSPFWFYIPILILAVLPWLGYLLTSLINSFRNKGQNIYFLLWFLIPFLFFSIAKGKLLTYILPCISPLAILIATYLDEALEKKNVNIIRINAFINISFGLLTAGMIFFSKNFKILNVYQAHENNKLLLAMSAFIFWALIGIISLSRRYWMLTAACTLILSLSIGYVIPEKIISNNTPEKIIKKYQSKLLDKPYLLTNNVGLGTALAWVLKRSDIYMLHQTGELGYGLKYPDSSNRFYRLNQLPALLEEHNYQDVALIVERSQDRILSTLPGRPKIITEGNLVFVLYDKIECFKNKK